MNRRVIAKAVLADESGNVLLVRRSETDPRRPNQWDFPGGLVEDNEEYKTACSREIQEEAGITVDAAKLELAYTEQYVDDERDMLVTWLIFTGFVINQPVTLSFEHSEYTWVPLSKAIELIEYDRQKRALELIEQNKLLHAA